jgi:hypothetical protein
MTNGRRWLTEKNNLYLVSGVLKHSNNKIISPDHIKQQLLSLHSDSPFAGHLLSKIDIFGSICLLKSKIIVNLAKRVKSLIMPVCIIDRL